MKAKFYSITLFVMFLSITVFGQKKIDYTPKLIENPNDMLEEVIQNDPKQGKKIGDINITKQRVSISKTSFAFQSATSYKNASVQSAVFKSITKLQLIRENKNLYILEVFDSRKRKKQFIIYSNNLEDLQMAFDALYTLKERATE